MTAVRFWTEARTRTFDNYFPRKWMYILFTYYIKVREKFYARYEGYNGYKALHLNGTAMANLSYT